MRQHTINKTVEFSGIGLHSGKNVHVIVHPAEENFGIRFRRIDLPNQPIIPAYIENLHSKMRCTSLAIGDANIFTTEHFLSTCMSLQLDNLLVDLDYSEFPGMDGSALPFLESLQNAGIVEQDAEAKVLSVQKKFVAKERFSKNVLKKIMRKPIAYIEVLPYPGKLWLEYEMIYTLPYLKQHVSFEITPEIFQKEIAGARTFALKSEFAIGQKLGFGQGANEENTLIICENGLPLNNTLRFSDEYARHKLLDLLGDLSLIGQRLEGHFIAHYSGHNLNGKLAQQLVTCNV